MVSPFVESADPLDTELAQNIRGFGVPTDGALSARRRQREVMYWRIFACTPDQCQAHKHSKGWISVGPKLSPQTAVEYTEFMQNKHAQPLTKYGSDVGLNPRGGGELQNPATRFDPILRTPGGINEFPDEQIIAYNWHKIPEVLATRPHLADVPDIKCEYGCPNHSFNNEAAYNKHLRAMHQEVSSAKAVGDQVGKLLEVNRVNTGLNTTELAAAIATAVMQFEANKGTLTIEPLAVESIEQVEPEQGSSDEPPSEMDLQDAKLIEEDFK